MCCRQAVGKRRANRKQPKPTCPQITCPKTLQPLRTCMQLTILVVCCALPTKVSLGPSAAMQRVSSALGTMFGPIRGLSFPLAILTSKHLMRMFFEKHFRRVFGICICAIFFHAWSFTWRTQLRSLHICVRSAEPSAVPCCGDVT